MRNAFPTATQVRLFVKSDTHASRHGFLTKPGGILLSPVQRVELENTLVVHTPAPDEMEAACFIPHHFFRYFDGHGKLVGEIQVCFCCFHVRATGASAIKLTGDQELGGNYLKLKALVRALGQPTDVDCSES